MNIQGFQKTTLLDFPGHVAATVFFGGCNFRCPFCHNKDLVIPPFPPPAYQPQEIFDYLEKRKNILDGVCITGGEPTLQPDLEGFLRSIKELGLLVKLDTNGYEPEILKALCQKGLADYIAMDIKGTKETYPALCDLPNLNIEKIETSIDFLLQGTVDYEFRTTVVRELHKPEDFEEIGKWIAGAKAYYLQGYQENSQVIHPGYTAYAQKDMEEFLKILKPHIPNVALRGIGA